jgi:hypothetical protein
MKAIPGMSAAARSASAAMGTVIVEQYIPAALAVKVNVFDRTVQAESDAVSNEDRPPGRFDWNKKSEELISAWRGNADFLPGQRLPFNGDEFTAVNLALICFLNGE